MFLPLHGSSNSEYTCGTSLLLLLFPNLHLFLHFITSTICCCWALRESILLWSLTSICSFCIVSYRFLNAFLSLSMTAMFSAHAPAYKSIVLLLPLFLIKLKCNAVLNRLLHHTSLLSLPRLLWNLASNISVSFTKKLAQAFLSLRAILLITWLVSINYAYWSLWSKSVLIFSYCPFCVDFLFLVTLISIYCTPGARYISCKFTGIHRESKPHVYDALPTTM